MKLTHDSHPALSPVEDRSVYTSTRGGVVSTWLTANNKKQVPPLLATIGHNMVGLYVALFLLLFWVTIESTKNSVPGIVVLCCWLGPPEWANSSGWRGVVASAFPG